MGDAAGDFFPGGLLLRAEEFGGVFEDEHVAVVDAVGAGAGFEQRDGGEQVHVVPPCRAARSHLHFAGGGAHAMAAAEEVVDATRALRRGRFFRWRCR